MHQAGGLHSLGIAPVLILVATVAACPAQIPTDAELYAQAQRKFSQGKESLDDPKAARRHFARAADIFAQLTRRGVYNAAHFRNQGNAEMMADRLPHAILAYRRGLQIAPNDADLQQALHYARKQVDYTAIIGDRPPSTDWPTFLPYPRLHWLYATAILFYTAAWCSWARWRMVDRRVWMSIVIFTVIMFAASCAGIWWLLQQQQHNVKNPVVVVAHDTPFYTGNSDKYPNHEHLPDLKRGMEARLVHRRGNWVQIRFASGEIGWTPRDAVLIDKPPIAS